METGTNKDWMDAVREQCLSEGAAPAAGSWEALGARMRRSAARRRAAIAGAAGMVGVIAAVLLWAPWRQPEIPGSPVAQQIEPAAPAVVQEQILEPESASQAETISLFPSFAGSSSPSFAGLTGESPAHPEVPSSKQAPDEDKPTEIVHPSSKQAQNEDGGEVLLALDEPKPRHRARIAIGLRAGTGPTRRDAQVSMQSAPYVAALNFLNTTDPSLMPRVKSNTNNTQAISATANAFFSSSMAGQYSHDLPLSLGLSLRMGLTPKMGLETGLEYTYLHSTEEFAGSRLNQQLHFVGIPVRLDASLWTKGGFGIYAGVGVKVEKCVSAKLGRVACEEPLLQWSAEAFGGVQYQLSRRTSLYFQPALSWYFTKTDLPTYRTEHPLGVTLHAGLRFDL